MSPSSTSRRELPSGHPIARAHPHSFGSTEFDARVSGDFRWSPIYHAGDGVPVVYGGEDDVCATCETIMRRDASGQRPPLVFATKYGTWQWSTIVPTRDLVMVDVTGTRDTGDTDLAAVGSVSYPASRAYAEKLLVEEIDVDGLVWTSTQVDGRRALVLFAKVDGRDGGITRGDLEPQGPSVPFVLAPGAERLRAIATDVGVTIIVP